MHGGFLHRHSIGVLRSTQVSCSGRCSSEALLRQKLIEYGLEPPIVDEIVGDIADSGFWERHGASPHLVEMMTECLRNAFSTFEGTAGGCRMVQGTGAGNPLADLMFTIAFSKVIVRLRRALEAAGLVPIFDAAGASEFLGLASPSDNNDHVKAADVSYADDLAFVLAAFAANMLAMIRTAGSIAWQVYHECGFKLNFAVNKTAVKICWKGFQARKCRLELEQLHDNKVQLEWSGKTVMLDVVQQYKHMGTLDSANGNMQPEIVKRSAVVWSKTSRLRKRLFGSPLIRPDVKRNVLRSILLSAQIFQAGCWPMLRETSMHEMNRWCFMSCYGIISICGSAFGLHPGFPQTPYARYVWAP